MTNRDEFWIGFLYGAAVALAAVIAGTYIGHIAQTGNW